MLDYTIRNIFRYGAISNSVQEMNSSHFPTWPPVKHVCDISQSHFFSITCLKWIKCFQIDKIFIIKTSYVLTELFWQCVIVENKIIPKYIKLLLVVQMCTQYNQIMKCHWLGFAVTPTVTDSSTRQGCLVTFAATSAAFFASTA